METYAIIILLIICVIAFVLWYVYWYAPKATKVDDKVSCVISWNWAGKDPIVGQQPAASLDANSNFQFISYGLSDAADGGIMLITHSQLYSSVNIVSYTYRNNAADKSAHVPKINGVNLSKTAVPYGKSVTEFLKNPISMSFNMYLVPGMPLNTSDSDFSIAIEVS
jgi:hypothetical protein